MPYDSCYGHKVRGRVTGMFDKLMCLLNKRLAHAIQGTKNDCNFDASTYCSYWIYNRVTTTMKPNPGHDSR